MFARTQTPIRRHHQHYPHVVAAMQSFKTKHGLTSNAQLADALGLNINTVGRWFNGGTMKKSWITKVLDTMQRYDEQDGPADSPASISRDAIAKLSPKKPDESRTNVSVTFTYPNGRRVVIDAELTKADAKRIMAVLLPSA